jgi:sugar lactone lactonase YvrE
VARRTAGLGLVLPLVLLLGCDEEPLPLAGRLWLVQTESQALTSVDLDDGVCREHAYVSEALGPLAFDEDERLLAVDLLARELVELFPEDGRSERLSGLSMVTRPLALTCAPDNRLFLLDDGRRVLELDPAGAWHRVWTLVPEGGWSGLAWLPEDAQSPNGEWLPRGTLLAWRQSAGQGELAWLEREGEQAVAHSWFATPVLAALETSARQGRLLALDAEGELLRLDPAALGWSRLLRPACAPMGASDVAVP